MALLALYWSIMIACYLLASRLRKYAEKFKFVDKLMSLPVYALVLLMGLRMGADEEVTSSLGSIGIQALFVTVLTAAGSMLGAFAVRIRDDSLEPVLHSGSVAYLNHDPLHAGDVGIFCVGGDMLCKQYYRDPLGVSYLFSLGRDRSADVVCGPESGKRFICFGHVILDHRVPLPGMGL